LLTWKGALLLLLRVLLLLLRVLLLLQLHSSAPRAFTPFIVV